MEDGIYRKKIGNNIYEYYYNKNNKEVSKKDLERIKKLRIPHVWNHVWISADDKEAIQATGIDSKGRKQYRYHEEHIEKAEKKKFLRLYDFIKATPKLEKAMERDSKLNVYDKERVMVTMLKIVKQVYMRVGKECYAKENKSYGITSLKKSHVKVSNGVVYLNFKGKSKKRLSYSINNKEIAKHINLLKNLDGEKLFNYIENDKIKKVNDVDLNQYIQQNMKGKFTCKDFRTYAANHYFIDSLLNETRKRTPKNEKIIKKNILIALKRTAFYLRHSRAISKKSYVMNFVMDMYQRDPNYFINNKDKETNDVLKNILKLYKDHVME